MPYAMTHMLPDAAACLNVVQKTMPPAPAARSQAGEKVLPISLDTFFGRDWSARHDAEIFGDWCNDATGHSFDD